MNFFQSILFGLVQALTEYFPVSSSAHIRILGGLLGQDPGAAFTAIIQFGTEFAVLLYFRHDIARILTHWFRSLIGRNGTSWKDRLGAKDHDAAMGWYIIVGTVPIVLAGLLFQHIIETKLRNLWITVVVLIVFGLLLDYFDRHGRQTKEMRQMNVKDALLFGVGQMLALVPGVSRSGGTITFGRGLGYTREAATRISFLMAIPAVFGAGILETWKSVRNIRADAAFPGWGATICATIVSFLVGYVVIIAFLKIVSKFSYRGFVIYRICLALVVAVLLLTGVIPAIGSASLS